NCFPSVPHIRFGCSVTILPSWGRLEPLHLGRTGANRLLAFMSRKYRFLPAHMPFRRNRARTFLCPSLWNGLAARSSRIASTSSSSLMTGLGPGRCLLIFARLLVYHAADDNPAIYNTMRAG